MSAAGIVAFSQANDFITHPNYEAFKTKTMQNYGLTAQQVDWAMQGSKNLPNIVNIMNRPGKVNLGMNIKLISCQQVQLTAELLLKPVCRCFKPG